MKLLTWTKAALVVLISSTSLSWAQDTTPAPPEVAPAAGAPPADAPTAPPAPTGVRWLEQPTAADYMRNYPRRALNEEIMGSATLDCLVEASGRLTCSVVSEEPAGYGFGEASIAVSRAFLISPQTLDGRPTEGGRVRRTIRWRLE